jgi:hypothetical protein
MRFWRYLFRKVNLILVTLDWTEISDTKEVYASIFDHGPAIRREVEFFVREFEVIRLFDGFI